MNALRIVVAVGLLSGLSLAPAAAQEKQGDDTRDRLLGVWEAASGSFPTGSTFELKQGDQFEIHVKQEGGATVKGTWKLVDDTLLLSAKVGTQERRQKLRIKKLTDTVLETEDESNKTDEFTRKK